MRFKITQDNINQRLDKYLTSKLTNFSRNQIQRAIKDGRILINSKMATPHYFLKEGDEVRIKNGEIKKEKQEERNSKMSEVEIIDDNKEYLIINKPAGLVAHGGESRKEITLVDFLLAKYPELKKIGDNPLRPGLVHRLDKEVSGLLVVPKTPDAFDNLKKQFQERKVKKEYRALVYGRVSKEEGEINFPLLRAKSGRMAALPLNFKKEARRAITEFKIIKRFVNYTLLKIKIKTGRTHQIRVHMFAYGHPIVGDNLYGTRMTKIKNRKLNLGRVFLVAVKLGFKNLRGERKEYKIDLPSELEEVLRKVK